MYNLNLLFKWTTKEDIKVEIIWEDLWLVITWNDYKKVIKNIVIKLRNS
jgi:hypothetical protein